MKMVGYLSRLEGESPFGKIDESSRFLAEKRITMLISDKLLRAVNCKCHSK